MRARAPFSNVTNLVFFLRFVSCLVSVRMPLFAEVLRDSKLFTLPPQSVARCIKSSSVPKHQVLQAPSASAHRKDWGLKFPVANPKTKRIGFEQFEDRFATNGVDTYNSFTRKISNLESLGAPITLPRSRRLRSLYDVPHTSASAPKKKGLEYLTSTEYAQKLKEAQRLKPNPGETKSAILAKLGVASYDPTGYAEPPKWQNSSIGATYASPGVLLNTPRGVLAQKSVRARALPGRTKRGAVAFGGFIGTDVNGITAQVPWFETLDLSVSSIGGTATGDIQINVNRETPRYSDATSSLLDRTVNV